MLRRPRNRISLVAKGAQFRVRSILNLGRLARQLYVDDRGYGSRARSHYVRFGTQVIPLRSSSRRESVPGTESAPAAISRRSQLDAVQSITSWDDLEIYRSGKGSRRERGRPLCLLQHTQEAFHNRKATLNEVSIKRSRMAQRGVKSYTGAPSVLIDLFLDDATIAMLDGSTVAHFCHAAAAAENFGNFYVFPLHVRYC